MADLDLLVFRMINDSAGSFPLWDALAIFMAATTPGVLVLALAWLWIAPGPDRSVRRSLAVLVMLGVFLAMGVAAVPGGIYYRLRPYMAHDVHMLVHELPSPSFPSTHSAGTAAAATILAAHSFGLGITAYLLLALMMYARVYTGTHYPSDVLVGSLLGWLCGLLIRCNRASLREFAGRIVAFLEEILHV